MIKESMQSEEEKEEVKRLSFAVLMMQGIATSIDALSIGFTTAGYGLAMAVVCSLIVAGGKTEGERSLYAECGLIMYPVGVDYNTGYDISGSICKIPWSNGSYSSICENIYWNDRTIFCSIYPILFI